MQQEDSISNELSPIISKIIILALALIGVAIVDKSYEKIYFPTVENGGMVEIPNTKAARDLSTMVDKLALELYTFDYKDVEEGLQNIRKYFTPEAYERYMLNWNENTTLRSIRKNRGDLDARLTRNKKTTIKTYKILKAPKELSGHKYMWGAEIYIDIRYKSENIRQHAMFHPFKLYMFIVGHPDDAIPLMITEQYLGTE